VFFIKLDASETCSSCLNKINLICSQMSTEDASAQLSPSREGDSCSVGQEVYLPEPEATPGRVSQLCVTQHADHDTVAIDRFATPDGWSLGLARSSWFAGCFCWWAVRRGEIVWCAAVVCWWVVHRCRRTLQLLQCTHACTHARAHKGFCGEPGLTSLLLTQKSDW